MVQQEAEADAGTDVFETVEECEGWALVVLTDGTVETRGPGGRDRWTTRDSYFAPEGRSYAFGASIETVLAHHLDETGRRRRAGRYVGNLRRGVRAALSAEEVTTVCDTCTEDATHIKSVSAPGGSPVTAPVCEAHGEERTYTTLYAME